ncbi:DUF881 domain-containing protein [Salipaludibacillus sp. CF4.18]|uniref:DUF881 domain-containing protein n=1 Tax=Salipaludibacillus sp. CF4.18 TaxID=3373081 RepID=UPI003EE58F52
MKGKHVMFSFVLLITGFLVSLSYQYTSHTNQQGPPLSDSQWQEEDELRNEVISEQQVNQKLTDSLREVQSQIKTVEDDISTSERLYLNLVEDIDQLRMVTGSVGVSGEGIHVKLDDAEYVPGEDNPNHYIVHEQHIQQIVDELLVAGAEAIAVNGHRIHQQSYIQCIGPVIEIDGETSFAPFEVTAIGDSETLDESLNLVGGVKDQLVNQNIDIRIEKRNEIILDPFFSEKG